MTNIQNVKITTLEIEDGTHYEGTITMEDVVFDYLIRLPDSFDKLDQIQDLNPINLLKSTSIEVKIGEQQLYLKEEEEGFFFGYGGLLARELFYSDRRNELRYTAGRSELRRVGTNVMNHHASKYSNRKIQFGLEKTMQVDTDNTTIANLLEKAKN